MSPPHLILENSAVVSLAQLVSPSVALPAQLVYYYKSLRIAVLDEEPLSHHMLFAVTEGTQEWTATFQDSACTASNQQVIYLTKGP